MIKIVHPAEEIPHNSSVLGLVVSNAEGVSTTPAVFAAFKDFIRMVKFREGEYIRDPHNDTEGRLVIVDFDHEKYHVLRTDMTPKTVLFENARAWPL